MFSKRVSKQKTVRIVPKTLFGVIMLAVAVTVVFPYSVYASPVSVGRLIELTNETRINRGLLDLSVDPALTLSAQTKSNDMLAKGYFDHTSPDGLTSWYWFDRAGYRYIHAGENLAADFESSEELFAAWMNSETHRDNILSPKFQDLGIAVAANETTILITQHFGSKTTKVAGINQTPPPAPKETTPPAPAPTPVPEAPVNPTSDPVFPMFLIALLGVGALGASVFGIRRILPQVVRLLQTPIALPRP